MSIDFGDNRTIGDVDLDREHDVAEGYEHPFEVDTRADTIVIAHETGERVLLEGLSVESAWKLVSDLEMAADVAGQYKRTAEESD